MVNRERLIKSFMDMVAISSPSGEEAAFRDYLIAYFSARGGVCAEDRAGEMLDGNAGNLLVRIAGTADVQPLMFLAHMDTVFPGGDIKAELGEDGVIRSVGKTILASDDKAGIAAIMEACETMRENRMDYPPLELLFTVSEEQGLLGAKQFDYNCLQSAIAYALDSGGAPGTIVVKSPCQNEIEYRVQGKAAHAGINPEDGINAIQIMAKALAVMPCGRLSPGTTCNFGIIKGGEARNIVAESCYVKGEARSLSRPELDRLTGELTRIFNETVVSNGGQPEMTVKFLYPEISLEENEQVVDLVRKAAQSLGLPVELIGSGGGSDAAIVNGNGIRCANLGIGMSDVHTSQEYIKAEDLVNDAELVLAIIQQYLADMR
ncbi:MAG TPA: M20/M25/M40 family metallo-hydrolase [Syntrophomonas sp.]|nr:M20/M25/M40 family metallo-hydrolase [Syntrophomonas sp.]